MILIPQGVVRIRAGTADVDAEITAAEVPPQYAAATYKTNFEVITGFYWDEEDGTYVLTRDFITARLEFPE